MMLASTAAMMYGLLLLLLLKVVAAADQITAPDIKVFEWKSGVLLCPEQSVDREKRSQQPWRGILTGLAREVLEIEAQTFTKMLELSCMHQIEVVVLTKGGKTLDDATRTIRNAQEICFPQDSCALFELRPDPPNLKQHLPNRIDRIAHLRDYQREIVRSKFSSGRGRLVDSNHDVVILIDLDLVLIPPVRQILQEAARLSSSQDITTICAAGLMNKPFGYYDIFATVWNSSTFAYPLAGRSVSSSMPHEDTNFIRSDEIYGVLTQEKMYHQLLEQGQASGLGLVEAKSCFGGLALYRASRWLEGTCNYTMAYGELMEYSNIDDGRPCEHVVFHNCLRRQKNPGIVTIQSTMTTEWDKRPKANSYMLSGGIIAHALLDDTGLVTSSRFPLGNRTLQNGNYTLSIEHNGSLAVLDNSKTGNETIRWSIDPPKGTVVAHDWDFMFLTLDHNGTLTLSMQTPAPCGRDDCFQSYIHERSHCQPCRSIVWQMDDAAMKGEGTSSTLLYLEENGNLRIISSESGRNLWSSEATTSFDSMPRLTLKSILAPHMQDTTNECIPSGDETAINKVLATGMFAEAVLCAGAVFQLKHPILFTASYQAVYTQGHPSGNERALLQVAHSELVTAINMRNQQHAVLSNVRIDGSREHLGTAEGPLYYEGLIRAGETGRGATIREIDAYHTRGWSTLHVAEGDPMNRCHGAIIERNILGPAGKYDPSAWADGLSLACPGSIVRNNTVYDATDVGIVVFGASGSLVEDNLVITRSRSANAGISMVDYDPLEGNFEGTVVQRNLVKADGATLAVGIAMGARTWKCIPNTEITNRLLHGAVVRNNTLEGSDMVYGFAVDGVRNWTVMHNVDRSKRDLARSYNLITCDGRRTSPPNGFQVDPSSSSGLFQKEFLNGTLAHVGTTLFHQPADSVPCYEAGETTRLGFFFAKIPKTAGTTVAGIARRITSSVSKNHGYTCNIRVGHGSPRKKFNYGARDKASSFLFSFVRNPRDRAISSFSYHEVSKRGTPATQQEFLAWTKRTDKNYQANFLKLSENQYTTSEEEAAEIIDSYDFIGVTDRFHESLVALALTLSIDVRQVLYLSAKRSGYAFTGDSLGNVTCVAIQRRSTNFTNEFFASDAWLEGSRLDQALFRAANQRLDAMIDAIGRQRFMKEIQRFEKMQQMAERICTRSIVPPCTAGGTVILREGTNCYTRDEGCGFGCLDALSDDVRTSRTHLDDELNRLLPTFREKDGACLPSGSEAAINKVLAQQGQFAEAVLCPGATFLLNHPIRFTSPYQAVYTQGNPTGSERALLQVAQSDMATAVNMLNQHEAVLSNVKVDGNVKELGKVQGTQYHEALIRAGGESHGAIIRNVDAYGARGWSTLHVAEGDLSNRCRGMVIEQNIIGPSGGSGHEATGLALACSSSTARNNTIVDFAAVGLALFGAPGSIVEDNRLIVKATQADIGIAMTDFAPFKGSYEGTVVQRNLIQAEHTAALDVGIAMGAPENSPAEQLLHGALISNNTFEGEQIIKPFTLDGVRDWLFEDNFVDRLHDNCTHASRQNNNACIFSSSCLPDKNTVELQPFVCRDGPSTTQNTSDCSEIDFTCKNFPL